MTKPTTLALVATPHEQEIAQYSTDLNAALDLIPVLTDKIDVLAEKLDRALVAKEAAEKDRHDANNLSQRLAVVVDLARRELLAVGANDAAARVQALLIVAMGGS